MIAVGSTTNNPKRTESYIDTHTNNVSYQYKDLVWILKGPEKEIYKIRDVISWETFFIADKI